MSEAQGLAELWSDLTDDINERLYEYKPEGMLDVEWSEVLQGVVGAVIERLTTPPDDAALRASLGEAKHIIDTMLCIYAPDMVGTQDAQEAHDEMYAGGGVLNVIANFQSRSDAVLASHPRPTDRDAVLEVTDEMVEAAIAAFNAPPDLDKCGRCEGRGYHHGFGEGGVDPDWCVVCGGSGYDIAADAEKKAHRAALEAAIRSVPTQTRDAVLEEAAKVAENAPSEYLHVYARGPSDPPGNMCLPISGQSYIAATIRSLKAKG